MRQKPPFLRRWVTLMLALSLMLSTALPAVQAQTEDGTTTSAPLLTCLPLTQWQEGQSLTSPLTYGDVQFYADNLRVGNLDGSGLPELTWTGQMKIFVPGATAVKLSVVQYGQPLTIVTYDEADNEKGRVSTDANMEGTAQAVELTVSSGMRKVMLLPGTGTGIGRYGLSSLCYSTPTSVARGEPDLTVAVDAPVRAVQGESIPVNLFVQNLGNAIASGSQTAGESGYRVELGLSKDLNIPVRPGNATAEFTEDMLLKRLAPTYDVAAGATVKYTSTVQIPENTPPGVYCLSGIVDTNGVVKEPNEQNNGVCDRIEIKAKGETTTDTSGLRWVDFRNQKVGTRGEQFTSGLTPFYAPGGSVVLDLNADSFNELLFSGGRLEVTLPQSSYVSASLVHYASPVTMEARYGDKVVGTKQTSSTDGKVDVLTINAEAIDKLIFTVPKGSQGALAQLGFQAPDLSGDACDPRVNAIASGFRHSLAILQDGTVWAWGLNTTGQLGNNSQSNKFEPGQVVGLRGALAVAAGREHSLALTNDGKVWAWGSNLAKQIGDGTNFDRWTPVQVSNLSNVTAIAAGYRFSLALKADGTVWAWGENKYGQLGDGTSDPRNTPVQVKGLTDVKAIATGASHSLAIKKDGTLWAWGSNEHGQLGDGTTTHRITPVQIRSLTEVEQVAGGLDHTLALKRDRTVWAWGKNDHGQLGDGTTSQRTSPKQVPGLPAALSIATGEAVSYAVRQDGTVWGWGYNPTSQLADGTNSDRLSPAQIDGVSNVIKIASGQASHIMTLNRDGRLWTWGSNATGQTAQLFSDTVTENPIEVNLKQALLYCPIVQQPLPEEEEPAEEPNPADSWKCTAPAFKDVPANDPACGAISMLVAAGVVNGYNDGTFKPQDPINRAAMTKMLVAALKMKANPAGRVTFKDTTGHWVVAQGWLQVAVSNGIVKGYAEDNTFRPDVVMKRSHVLSMASGALNIARSDGKPIPTLGAPATPPTAHLKDVKSGDWFYDPVVLSLRANLIGPTAPFPIFTGAQLDPDKDLTRGEAAIIVANLLIFREQ